MKILVAGASGGIGLAIVKECLHRYPDAVILATCHSKPVTFHHPQVQWHTLDIRCEAQVARLAGATDVLDMVINAIGFLHSAQHRPEKSLKDFDTGFFAGNISLNTLSGVLLAKYFEKALQGASGTSYFVAISAKIGSIKDNNTGGWLSYRMSKAALNMALKTVSIEWRRKLPNCCVLLFHPGTTDTPLSLPFQKNLPAGQLHSPAVTAKALLDLIAHSGPRDSGRFVSYSGNEIEW